MIYLTSITVLVCLLLLATTLGRRIVDFLPSSFRDSVGFYIAPILGLACIVLITTVYGWLSPFKTNISILLSVGILLLGFVFERKRTDLLRDWLIVSAFAIVATIPILAPAIRFDSYNPFNDTFTYLAHGQWLQEHSFSEIARASGFFPAETQIVLYQRSGLRMGGSFFLGFVQSLFRLEWSYYAYLPTVAAVFVMGSLAIGGAIRQVTPVSRIVGLALCALPALSMNGFVFGAQHGFFPQTFGLAFAAGLTCLIPSLLASTLDLKPAWGRQFLYVLPPALLCAALLISYNEIFPIVTAIVGLFFLLMCGMYWSDRYHIIIFFSIFLIEASIFTNVEGFRILKSFVSTVLGAATGTVHFGWPMYWSPLQFLAHSFGMKTPFQSDVFLVDRIMSSWVFPCFFIITMFVIVRILKVRPRNFVILFLICSNIIFWLAFLKFRYATTGLEGEVGNTFLQFKIAKWASPFNIALFGIVIAWVYMNFERLRSFTKYLFLTVFLGGLIVHYVIISQMFTTQFQDETMRKYSPFSVFSELRSRVASIPKDQIIYLGIPAEHHKLTQMVAYVLSDRKLSSSYVEDGYLRGSIPEHERDMPIENADWMIQLKPNATIDENPLNRVGPFLIRRAPFSFFSLESVTGSYGTETSDKNSWNWVKESVQYRFHRVGKSNHVRVKFQFTGNPGILFMEAKTPSGGHLASFDIPLKTGWGKFESPIINSNADDIIIQIRASGTPVRLSVGDPREVQFLIQNISLESEIP